MSEVVFEGMMRTFRVPLTEERWEALNAVDGEGEDIYDVYPRRERESIKKLMAAGCDNLDWNGHFGSNFFFDVAEEDVEKAKAAVTEFVQNLQPEKEDDDN